MFETVRDSRFIPESLFLFKIFDYIIMELRVVEGKNKKIFIGIIGYPFKEGTTDNLIYKTIQSVCKREEYKPFIKSFNKTIKQSYLFNDVFFPIQFWQDIESRISKIVSPSDENYPQLTNFELLTNLNFSDAAYDDWLDGLKLPEKYDIFDPRYLYQPESVRNLLKAKIGRITVGTGGGKTMITYLLCKNIIDNNLLSTFENGDKGKILIVVPRKDLCSQLKTNFKEYDELNTNKLIVETIYSGGLKSLNAQITVGTYQSISDYEEEFFNQYTVVIFDELHTAKTYSIIKDIYSKCYGIEYVFGMTGTMPDYKTLDYLNIVSMCGPLVYEKKTRSLMDDGNVVPIKIKIIRINYDEDKNYSKDLLENGIVGIDKYRTEKNWFQTNPNRNDLLLKLIKSIGGNNLILVDSKSYIQLLAEFFRENLEEKVIEIIVGETTDAERLRIKSDMEENDNIILLATFGTMSTGVSINNIMNIYFPDGGKSTIRMNQSIGRGLRLHPNKEYLMAFDFQDWMEKSSFKNHSKERNKMYAENGFDDITITNITI